MHASAHRLAAVALGWVSILAGFGGALVSPLFGDPRADPRCASVFGDAVEWRREDPGGLDVMTREDVRFGRSQPVAHPQLGPLETCFGDASSVVLRQVPKSGSSAIGKLMREWPLQSKCVPKEKRKGFTPPLFVAFVRHPFSRLVSGFHTIMTFLGECYPSRQIKYLDHGPVCDALRMQAWWRAFEATKEPGRKPKLDLLTPREVRLIFRLFVRDVLAPDAQAFPESGRNGLEPVLHHIHSQLYFLSLKAHHPALCAKRANFLAAPDIDRGPGLPPLPSTDVCNPRLDFVGKLEELEAHLPAMLAHFGNASGGGEQPLRAMFQAWERGNPKLRAGAHKDSQSKRYVDEGGKLFEESLVPSMLGDETMGLVKDYFKQDMACLGYLFNYSWDIVEVPKWHAEVRDATTAGIVNSSISSATRLKDILKEAALRRDAERFAPQATATLISKPFRTAITHLAQASPRRPRLVTGADGPVSLLREPLSRAAPLGLRTQGASLARVQGMRAPGRLAGLDAQEGRAGAGQVARVAGQGADGGQDVIRRAAAAAQAQIDRALSKASAMHGMGREQPGFLRALAQQLAQPQSQQQAQPQPLLLPVVGGVEFGGSEKGEASLHSPSNGATQPPRTRGTPQLPFAAAANDEAATEQLWE